MHSVHFRFHEVTLILILPVKTVLIIFLFKDTGKLMNKLTQNEIKDLSVFSHVLLWQNRL